MNGQFDNARPRDPAYPTFRPAVWRSSPLVVETGDMVVNTDGDLLTVTSGNSQWVDAPQFLHDLNLPCIRAAYLGNSGDFMEIARGIRKATVAEVERARTYRQQAELLDILNKVV
jgi:hypothetical protein